MTSICLIVVSAPQFPEADCIMYLMVSVPPDAPNTLIGEPDVDEIVAIVLFVLLHAPPAFDALSETDVPRHTPPGPVRTVPATGNASTVIVLTALNGPHEEVEAV